MNKRFWKIQKLICTCVSAIIPCRELRHKVRYALDPLNDKRCVDYFKRKYVLTTGLAHVDTDAVSNSNANTASDPQDKEFVWQCWLQGVDKAPALVRRCLDSVAEHCGEQYNVVVLTEDTWPDYVSLPSVVLRKRRAGLIGDAQFSDILRVCLLARYGGWWVDATCLATSAFPSWVIQQPFFMFRSCGEFAYTAIQSCFIRAQRGSYLARRWRQLMLCLWENEGRTLHYFQLHLMFKAMIEADPTAAELFANAPSVSEEPTHTLLEYMKSNTPFSERLLCEAVGKSFIHKLTYKHPAGGIADGSFADHFLSTDSQMASTAQQ